MSVYQCHLACNMINYTAAILLCYITIREHLIKPLWRLIFVSAMAAAAFYSITSVFSGFVQSLLVPFFLAAAFFYYSKASSLPHMKQLFLILVYANFVSFIVSMCDAFKLPLNETRVFVDLAIVLACFPPVYFVMRKFWVSIFSRLSERSSRFLWLLPLYSNIVIIFLTFFLTNAPRQFHLIIRFLTLIYSVFIYLMVFYVLYHTIMRNREEERAKTAAVILKVQQEQYEALQKHIRETMAAQHDLRHQLTALRQYLSDGKQEEAMDYCESLYNALPSSDLSVYCENYAVNALMNHYHTIALAEAIAVELQLEVPVSLEPVSDQDLCIIFGNYFENAIEACGRMSSGEKFICIKSALVQGKLVITMDNSFDGICITAGDGFATRKVNSAGIGLSSVNAVVKKYQGTARYEAEESIFRSSCYLTVK